MDEKHERTQRRRAIKLWLQKVSPSEIARRLKKSERWVFKWIERFRNGGRHWARSQSRAPHSTHGYDEHTRQVVIRLRKQLVKAKVGLIGPREIHEILQDQKTLAVVPSIPTIERILHENGLVDTVAPARAAYFPQPTAREDYVLHLMDWAQRYLKGGTKVYAFHTMDIRTRDLHQSISADKSGPTVRRHVIETWQSTGLPHALQMDNDPSFCGGYKVKRVFGALVRLCLFVGVEPIFIPLGEAKRNGEIEQINGLWSRTFWKRFKFRTVADVKRAQPRFVDWYRHHYHPRSLSGLTVSKVCEQTPVRRLSKADKNALPSDNELPITAGRVHFIRLVDEYGDISFLNETWHVHKRLASEYVLATIVTHEQTLRIYHRRSADDPVDLVKMHHYQIPEKVAPLLPRFQRDQRRRKNCTML